MLLHLLYFLLAVTRDKGKGTRLQSRARHVTSIMTYLSHNAYTHSRIVREAHKQGTSEGYYHNSDMDDGAHSTHEQ